MEPLAIILQAAAQGIRFKLLENGLIQAKGKRSIAEKWLPIIKANKWEIIAALKHVHVDYTAFNNRVAIIQYQAGIPQEWAEAFVRVYLMQRPQAFKAWEWQTVLDGVDMLLYEHVRALINHGWAIADIFAIHPTAPLGRTDCKGLLALLREGEKVEIVTAQAICTRKNEGALLCYRKPLSPSPERRMLWELA